MTARAIVETERLLLRKPHAKDAAELAVAYAAGWGHSPSVG